MRKIFASIFIKWCTYIIIVNSIILIYTLSLHYLFIYVFMYRILFRVEGARTITGATAPFLYLLCDVVLYNSEL